MLKLPSNSSEDDVPMFENEEVKFHFGGSGKN
jgi:hypothetical protein